MSAVRRPDRLSYYSGPSSDRQDHEATSSVSFWTEIIPRISIGAKNNHCVEVLAAVKCLEKDAQGLVAIPTKRNSLMVSITRKAAKCRNGPCTDYEILRRARQDIWFRVPVAIYPGSRAICRNRSARPGLSKDGNQQLHLNRLVCLCMRFITSGIGCYKTSRKDRVIVEP